MFAVFLIPAALFLHAFWTFDDPAQRQTQRSNFYRNVMMLGSFGDLRHVRRPRPRAPIHDHGSLVFNF